MNEKAPEKFCETCVYAKGCLSLDPQDGGPECFLEDKLAKMEDEGEIEDISEIGVSVECPLWKEFVVELRVCPKHPELGEQLAEDPCSACEEEDRKILDSYVPAPQPCPHGKMEECDACDTLSDFAYDAARERGSTFKGRD